MTGWQPLSRWTPGRTALRGPSERSLVFSVLATQVWGDPASVMRTGAGQVWGDLGIRSSGVAFTWLLLAGRNTRCGATRVHVLAAHIGRRLEALFQAPSYSGALDVCYAEARARGQAVAGSAAQEDQ